MECKRDNNDNRIIKSFVDLNPEYKNFFEFREKVKSSYIDLKSYKAIREKNIVEDNDNSDLEDDEVEKYGLLGLVNF